MYSTKVSVCLMPISISTLIGSLKPNRSGASLHPARTNELAIVTERRKGCWPALKRWSDDQGVAELYRMFAQALCSLPEVVVLSALRFATALSTPLLPRLTHPGAEVMRSTLALPLAVLLSAYVPDAVSQQLPSGCSPLKGEARQQLIARFTGGTPYECFHPRHADVDPKTHNICEYDPIPVYIFDKDAGDVITPNCPCWAVLKYSKLTVHTLKDEVVPDDRTKIIWRLRGPRNYAFADTTGIHLQNKADIDITPPGYIYEDRGQENEAGRTKRRYRWVVKMKKDRPVYPEKTFEHFPTVLVLDANNRPTGKYCQPIDPDITNTSN